MKTNNYKTIPEITLKYKKGNVEKRQITSPSDSYEVLKNFFNKDTIEINEEFLVLFLSRSNKTIGWIKHSSGGSVSSVVDRKLILTTALQCGAQSLIVAHNHPSGNKEPSQGDINLTRKLKDACTILDMTLLDHLIITEDGYCSMQDEGMF